MCVPLFAAEVIYVQARSRLTINPRYLLAAFTSMAAVVQAIAWYANAHRYAVGDNGPLLFFAQSEWAPPLGWIFWLIIIAGASVAILAAGLLFLPNSQSNTRLWSQQAAA